MKFTLPLFTLGSLLLLVGCATSSGPTSRSSASPNKPDAVAVLTPASNALEQNVRGQVTFTKVPEGVRVRATVEGLTPNGKHGFHIHEKGDCTASDLSSAGGHFNPTGAPHGAPQSEKHHAGDFGNLQADAKGKAKTEFVAPWLTLEGPHSVIGRAVIVHEKADDLTTQPTGNAGGRWACGVIQNLNR